MKAAIVYMVAWMASRFGWDIKQLAKVGPNNETLIELSIQEAIKAWFSDIFFIVGKKTETPFQEEYGNEYKGVPIKYTFQDFNEEQRDKPRGTTDALLTIKETIDCPFVVCNWDDLYGIETFTTLYNHIQEDATPATVGYHIKDTLPESGTVNRGIFETEGDLVTNLVENFDISKENFNEKGLHTKDLCSMNIFALQPDHLTYLEEKLIQFKKEHTWERRKESIIPTEINKLIQEDVIDLQIYPTNDTRYGITNPEDEQIIKDALKDYSL